MLRPPATPPPTARPRGLRLWAPALALVVLGAALTLPRLGSGLWDPWEARYVQGARETAAHGNFLVPWYRDWPRLMKPPLTYALIAGAQAAGGVNEAASRLPSAILATLSAAGLALAFGVRGRPLEGLLSGGALLTAPQWILLGRFATPDVPFAAFAGGLLAIAVAAPAILPGRGRTWLGVGAIALLAAAALTEWPRGLLVPAWGVGVWTALRAGWWVRGALLATAILYFVGQHLHVLGGGAVYAGALILLSCAALLAIAMGGLRSVAGLRRGTIAIGGATVLLAVGAWMTAIFLEAPEGARYYQLGYKHPLNLGEDPGEHTGPPYYPLLIVLAGSLPWAGAVLAGATCGRWCGSDDDPFPVVGAAWAGALLFFTLSEARMGHFYAVLQPPTAALAALGVGAAIRERGWRLAVLAAGTAALAALSIRDPRVILESATVKRQIHDAFDPTLVLGVTVAAWLATIGVAAWRRRPAWAAAGILPAAILAGTLGIGMVPRLEAQKSIKPMWLAYLAHRTGDEPIASYGLPLDSGFYYSDNAIGPEKTSPEKLREYLSGGGARYLVLERRRHEALDPRKLGVAGRWEEIDRSHPTHSLLRFVPADPEEGRDR